MLMQQHKNSFMNSSNNIFVDNYQRKCRGIVVRGVLPYPEMLGDGILSDLLGKFDFVKKGKELLGAVIDKPLSSLSDVAFGATATEIRNQLAKLSNNPNKATLFPGEKHALLKTKYNKIFLDNANFLGPGTFITDRKIRGDRPIDGLHGLDQCAMVHDMAYQGARNFRDVRKADNEFLKCLDNAEGNKAMKTFVKGLFKAKKIGEDLGVINPDLFAHGISVKKLPGTNLKKIISRKSTKKIVKSKKITKSKKIRKEDSSDKEGGQLGALVSLIASVAIPELIKVIKKSVKGKKKNKKRN